MPSQAVIGSGPSSTPPPLAISTDDASVVAPTSIASRLRFALRACFVNHRATEADVRAIVSEVLAVAGGL